MNFLAASLSFYKRTYEIQNALAIFYLIHLTWTST